MTKTKSKNWRKIKVLIILPAVLLLVIAFSSPPETKAFLANDVVKIDFKKHTSVQDKKEKLMKQEKLNDKKTKDLKDEWTALDKKLADQSLSQKEKEVIFKK